MANYRSAVAVLAGVTLFLTGAPLAFAQASQGLEVKPAVIEDNTTPGATYHFTVTVTNVSSAEHTFTVVAKDISGLDDKGLPVFALPGQETIYSLSSWIQLPQAPITLAAGESKTVSFTVLVPANASPGSHFGGVFFDTSTQQVTTTGSAISVEVGSVINLQIAGNIIEDARIQEFSTDSIIYGSPAVAFTTKVENMGNVLVTPHGVIQITDMLGHQVGTVTVNDSAAPVFPGSVRSYTTSWQGAGFAIGRYQAVLSLSYGTEAKRTISAVNSFWIIPFKLTLIVVGSLLALILIIYLWVRLYLRRQLRSMGITPAAKGGDLGYYGKKYNRNGSRLAFIALAVLFLCIILLVVLFMLFA